MPGREEITVTTLGRGKRRPMARFGLSFFVGVLCILLFSATVIVDANPFVDVPAGHWAYGALEQLSAAALVDGYSPGFFTGARRLTRYEMALSVAGALDRLQGDGPLLTRGEEYDLGQLVNAYNARHPDRPLSAAEAELLRAIVAEFREELGMLGHAVPSMRATSEPPDDVTTPRRTYLLDGSVEFLARHRLLVSRPGGAGTATTGDRQVEQPDDRRFRSSGNAADALSQRVVEVYSGVALGRIGSTVLFTEAHSSSAQVHAWERTTTPLLDGSIHLSEHALPGALLADVSQRPLMWPFSGTETLVGVESVAVTPFLSFDGERARRSNLQGDAGATAVRATVLLGSDVSLAGRLRTVEPGFDQADGDAVGVGLTVRLGDVLLSTGRDIVQRSEEEDADHVTSWSLEYSLAEQAQVRAGWQSVSDTRSRTSVDLNVPVPQGALHLGLAYEGPRNQETAGISMTTLTMAGVDVRVWDNAEARAAISVRDTGDESERTTSLGLRYTLSPEAALLLGYKLIDFTSEAAEGGGRPENVTTAEFSIRF